VKFAFSRSGKPYVWSIDNVDNLAQVFGPVMHTLASYPGAKLWQLIRLSTLNLLTTSGTAAYFSP
ncbi:unnamed protein product, partial [Amoebophrya sp. A120]